MITAKHETEINASICAIGASFLAFLNAFLGQKFNYLTLRVSDRTTTVEVHL